MRSRSNVSTHDTMNATIGVVGGMGNEAMADLAANVASLDGSADHSYVLYGNSRQAFTPEEADQEWEPGDPPLLRKRATGEFTAALLQNLGAAQIGLSCNGAHPLFRDIFRDLDADFVDMIAETARVPAVDDGVLVLGTSRTLEKRLYDDDLEAAGVEAFQPTPRNVDRLMDVIYDPEFGIKTGTVTDRAEGLLCELVREECDRHPAIDTVVLGCTELPLALTPESIPRLKEEGALPEHLTFVDPTQVLAERLLDDADDAEPPSVSLAVDDSPHLDYDPPFAACVGSLSEMVTLQSNLIEWTMEYFADRGASVGGSYLHLPTLFFVDYDRPIPLDLDALDLAVQEYDAIPSEPDDAIERALERNFEQVSHLL